MTDREYQQEFKNLTGELSEAVHDMQDPVAIATNWTGLLLKALVIWGPPVAFLLGLGCIYWLKTKGWL